MDVAFKIYIDRLRDGQIEHVRETFSPEFLEIHEKDLAFTDPVSINAEVYLADDVLVWHGDIVTQATMPCTICNEPVKITIAIEKAYLTVPVEEIKGHIFDFREMLRETILLETPNLAECNEGNCPKRKTLQKYFKKEDRSKKKNDEEEGYRPFADLDFEQMK